MELELAHTRTSSDSPPANGTTDRSAAIRAVASHAHDATDLAHLCGMLGLDPTESRQTGDPPTERP